MGKEYVSDMVENTSVTVGNLWRKKRLAVDLSMWIFPPIFDLLHVDPMSSTQCPFYVVPEEGRFIALEAYIRQNISFTAE